jgi:hypothetical protein
MSILAPLKNLIEQPSEQIVARFVVTQLGTPLLIAGSSLPLLALHFFPKELPFRASLIVSGACLMSAIAIHLSYQAVLSFNKGKPLTLKTFSETTERLFHYAVKYFNLINTSTLAIYGLQQFRLIHPVFVGSSITFLISTIIGLSLFILSASLKNYDSNKQ